ncbi:Bax inhibitor-1/YccA family protein [Terrisporobacter sp.]
MIKEIYNPIGQVFKYLSISIFFMFVGYMFGLFLPDSFIGMANIIFAILIVGLLIMAIISKKSIIPRRFSMNFVYLFTFVDGILISPVIRYYVGSLGSGVVINVLIATLVICGVLGFIASKSESDRFLKLGPVLFAALIGLLVMSILNIFIYGRLFNIIVSIIGVLLFSAYILYDVSLLKSDIEYGNIKDRDDLSIHVLNLYIDFVNIFLDLLRLVREFSDY